jgi:hypothetical protein
MQAQQTYRTMARMERRRSFVQSRLGMREDFGRQSQPTETAVPTAPVASEPEYVGELERLSHRRDQGILSDEEFEAKRSRSSVSERRVRHRRENARSAVMYWSAVGRPPKGRSKQCAAG